MTSSSASSASRLRILHCISHVSIGGAERIAVSIARQLNEEFEFSVFAVRGVGRGEVGAALHRELAACNIPVHVGPRVPMRFGGMITGAAALARALQKSRADLVHLHTEIPEASCAALFASWPPARKVSLIRTVHSSGYWEFWRGLGRWCDRRLSQARITGVSPGAINAFSRLRGESGAPPPEAAPMLVYNGVSRAPSRPASPIPQKVRLVYGGRLEREKGVDLLPEIILRTRLPDGCTGELTLFGTGPYRSSLADFARNAPRSWRIELHEPVADFRTRLGAFDLVIIPSRFEGLPLVAIEASMAGLPAIATDSPGLRDTLPPAHPWLASPGDARSIAEVLTRAIHNRGEWASVGSRQRAFVEQRFGLEQMIDGYRALYRLASR